MKYFDTAWSIISNLSLIHWLLFTFGVAAVGIAVGMRKFLRQQWRLYKNLRRPVKIITPTTLAGAKIPGTEMEGERELLRSTQMLNIDDTSTNYRNFNPTTNHCLVVLGYHTDMAGLDDVLNKVKARNIPLVVYTYGKNINAIATADKQKFDEYPLTLIANFHLTLVNHIFSTLASYPNGKYN